MPRCVCLLSGGQDSTTTLFWAKSKFNDIHALIIDYGQRHKIEIESAKKIASIANVQYKVLNITNFFHQLTVSSLIDCSNISTKHALNPDLPSSFVPGRNIIFLTSAAIMAHQLNANDIVTGVCETDYSGYPDCRRNTIDSIENTIALGIGIDINIYTPLMYLNKKETVDLAIKLDGCMDAMKYSHTCYNGYFPPCGNCPSCILRAKGFKDANIIDPILTR